jgi:hypothetical protein
LSLQWAESLQENQATVMGRSITKMTEREREVRESYAQRRQTVGNGANDVHVPSTDNDWVESEQMPSQPLYASIRSESL